MALSPLLARCQKVIGPILALGFLAYFIYHIIQGERGIMSWMRLEQKIQEAEIDLEKVQAEHDALQHRVQLLRPDSLDPDMLDERVRQAVNFARTDEVILTF